MGQSGPLSSTDMTSSRQVRPAISETPANGTTFFSWLALLIQKLSVWREIGDIVGMEYLLDRKGERRLAAYFHRIGEVLRTAPQRASFATYALGLMGDGERKSMEPMAARACPNPEGVNAAHERLTYFTRGAGMVRP